jgi:hypothetical protein
MAAAAGAVAACAAAACAAGACVAGSAALVVEKLFGAAGLTMRSQPSKTNTEFHTLPFVEPIA